MGYFQNIHNSRNFMKKYKKDFATSHPFRIATVKKKKKKIASVGKDVETLEPLCPIGGNRQLLWKIVQSFLKKLKIELPCDPAIPLLCIYTKELKAGSQRDICMHIISAILAIANPDVH